MKLRRSWFAGVVLAVAACATPDSGVSQAEVIGGRRASESEIYGTVAVQLGGGLCTGTLIAEDVVVTAAHCVSEDGFLVGAGSIRVLVSSRNAHSGGEAHGVRRVHPHPSYPGWSGAFDPAGLRLSHDIALLELDAPVRSARPVPILAPARLAGELREGVELLVSGYGVNDGFDDGSLYLARVPFVRSSDSEILAGRRGTPDTCNGDSGGPAYLELDGGLALVGATSRAREDSSTECGAGGIYTLVPSYVEWIERTLGRAVPLAEERPELPDAGPPPTDAGQDAGRRVEERPADAAMSPERPDASGIIEVPPRTQGGALRGQVGCGVAPTGRGDLSAWASLLMLLVLAGRARARGRPGRAPRPSGVDCASHEHPG